MIPIECPNCGREGNVPPDRLNARLVCRGCQTVFYMDNTGRMVLGEPGSNDPKKGKPRSKQSSVSDFDLAQTLKDIPKPVRYGVPAVLLAVIGYMFLGGGESGPSYLKRARSAIQAVVSNDRSQAVSYASSDTGDAAGKWFDLLHSELEKSQIGSDITVNPSLMSGNPEKDSELTLLVVMARPESTSSPLTITLQMKREGSSWVIEGNKCLANVESELATARKSN